jgi:hypothetical protein
MYIVTNMHRPPADDKYCDECWKAKRPVTVEDYSQYMGCVSKGKEWLIAIQLVGEHGRGFFLFLLLGPNYTE